MTINASNITNKQTTKATKIIDPSNQVNQYPEQDQSYLMWFRRDLRLDDNTALTLLMDKALQSVDADNKHAEPRKIHAVYTITPEQWLEQDMSLVQMDFIFRTIKQLAETLLNKLGIILQVVYCDTFTSSVDAIEQICLSQSVTQVFANIEYEVNEQDRDESLTRCLNKHSIEFNRYHDQCILPPNTVKTNDDTMYKVFTPFYKKWQSILEASPVILYKTVSIHNNFNPSKTNSDLNLQDTLIQLDEYHSLTLKQFQKYYDYSTSAMESLLKHGRQDYPAGEGAAKDRLTRFIKEDIQDYNTARDKPALMATSQISAYLTIGCISARLCFQQANKVLTKKQIDSEQSQTDIERWISELAWRDFYRHVIHNRPDIVKGNAYKVATDKKVNWSYDEDDFQLWCEGNTGVPLVDAAMSCLNQTGFMHNRLRMVTAMFLTKDLLINWRLGERYFMQQLIDGDFASNNGGWQWSASVGTDASPYFRIMNPFSQASTHDKEAVFIKTWLPELKNVPANILHDEIKLRKALGKEGAFTTLDYPEPMVEHRKARLYAIDQFKG